MFFVICYHNLYYCGDDTFSLHLSNAKLYESYNLAKAKCKLFDYDLHNTTIKCYECKE